MGHGVGAVEGCRARTPSVKKGVKTVNICVLHFTICPQTPPNNTRHIMDTCTHIHGLDPSSMSRVARCKIVRYNAY